MRVTRGPRENGFRPALDPLYRTAALAYRARVIGVILSGGQDDGVLGLSLIKKSGGLIIAQDPRSAESSSMPARRRRFPPSAVLLAFVAFLSSTPEPSADSPAKPEAPREVERGCPPERAANGDVRLVFLGDSGYGGGI